MAVPNLGKKIFEEHAAKPVGIMDAVIKTPEEAAAVLGEFLPPETFEDIRIAAGELQVPLWQMLLGYVMRCTDSMLTYSPFLLSTWEGGGKASSMHKCHGCGGPFFSRVVDAQWCCERCAFDKLIALGHSADCLIGTEK